MDAERPEPEEHWNNRQFDDMYRQALNSCSNCLHNNNYCDSCQRYSNHEVREQKTTNEAEALPMPGVRCHVPTEISEFIFRLRHAEHELIRDKATELYSRYCS